MRSGEVEANLLNLQTHFDLPWLPDLIARKVQGHEHEPITDVDLAFHEREYVRLVETLELAQKASHLPDEASCQPELNDLLLDIRGVR